MKLIRILFIGIIILAGLGAIIPFLIPASATPPGYAANNVAQAVFFITLALGSAGLFLLGLRGFRPESKRAATLLAVGAVIHALGWSTAPIIFMYNPTLNTVALALLSDLPYLIGTILIFLGLWQFARLLELKSWVTDLRFVLPFLLVVLIVTSFLPHAIADQSELIYDGRIGIVWLEVACNILSVILLWRLLRTISRPYTSTISCLLAMTAVNLIASSSYLYVNLNNLFMSSDPRVIFFTTNILGNLYNLHILLFAITSYFFTRITRGVEKRQSNATAIDVITYVANLASLPPHQFDRLLDPLRTLTASLPADQSLDKEALSRLAIVYRDLEAYLIENDQLRNFSRKEIRQRVQHHFDQSAYESLFSSLEA